MAAGRLKAVVCTSTLDLGIDWGDVDLVINVGAPKGASRLHAADRPRQSSARRAVARDAGAGQSLRGAGMPRRRRRGARGRAGYARRRAPAALDVLASIFSAWPARRRSTPMRSMPRCVSAEPYAGSTARRFRRGARFRRHRRLCAEELRPLRQDQAQRKDGRWRVANPRVAQSYRMNVGTIVEADMLKVRLVRGSAARGKPRGAALLNWPALTRERGASQPIPAARRGGRCSARSRNIFSRRWRRAIRSCSAARFWPCAASSRTRLWSSRANAEAPKVPSYAGGKFPLSTYLAARVRALLADPAPGARLPEQVAEWLMLQRDARSCRRPASFWSKLPARRAAFISSPIRSRGGSRIRRSACC